MVMMMASRMFTNKKNSIDLLDVFENCLILYITPARSMASLN